MCDVQYSKADLASGKTASIYSGKTGIKHSPRHLIYDTEQINGCWQAQ